MGFKKQDPGCNCCDTACPPGFDKEAAGLPDTITLDLTITSSSSAGMPADSVLGDGGCVDGPSAYYRWTEGHPLASILSRAYDFTEQSECCFLYTAPTDYTPTCPSGPDQTLFGESPYGPKASGASTQTFSGGPCVPYVCGGCVSNECCGEYWNCGNTQACDGITIIATDGELQIPLPIFGTATLLICVSGNVVTITASATVLIPCELHSGSSCTFVSEIPCGTDATPEVNTCTDETTTCAHSTGGVTATATADLTETAGATIWDKIKAYAWEFTYGESSCSCAGGGCAGTTSSTVTPYEMLETCHCSNAGASVVDSSDDPTAVDVDCFYDTGLMDGTLT